jgi:hypothetical protein
LTNTGLTSTGDNGHKNNKLLTKEDHGMKKPVAKLLLGLLVTGLLSTAWGGMAWAQEPDRGDLLRGTVASIEGTALVISTSQGERSVLTDEDTTFRVPGVEMATLDDVAVGDHVVVHARPAEDSTLLARVVAVVPVGQEGDIALRGLVTAVEDTTLTVRTRRGEIAVLADEQTLFRVPGVEDPTIADVQAGQVVLVLGRPEGDESFRAAAVTVVPRGVVVRRHTVHGKVTAVGERTLTVDTPRGEQFVFVDENTRLRMPGVEDPDFADITPGTWIVAVGSRNEDGSLQARLIVAISERLQRHSLRGRVTAVEGSVLTIEARRGQVQVLTDEKTRYWVALGMEQISLEDIAVGDKVIAFGRRTEDGDALAVAIIVLPQR